MGSETYRERVLGRSYLDAEGVSLLANISEILDDYYSEAQLRLGGSALEGEDYDDIDLEVIRPVEDCEDDIRVIEDIMQDLSNDGNFSNLESNRSFGSRAVRSSNVTVHPVGIRNEKGYRRYTLHLSNEDYDPKVDIVFTENASGGDDLPFYKKQAPDEK